MTAFAHTNFRRISPNIRRPRAAASSYDPGKLPAVYAMPVGLKVAPAVIVVYELDGKFYPNDAALWAAKMSATLGVEVPIPNIKTHLLPGADDSAGDADGEVALDWQKEAEFWYYITGTAANILIVYGPNTGAAFADCIDYTNGLTAQDLQNLFGIAALFIAAASWSWGQEEDQWAVGDLNATNASASKASYAITGADGDGTAYDGSTKPTVDGPACLPSIVAGGGTSFAPGGMEAVWNNGGGEGTGGGFSKIYSRPAWQPINSQGTGRMVPDMAMDADPNTGHNVVVNGQWQVIGGTSAVAPMMAGLLAVVNGVRAANGLPSITGAVINAMLWANPSCFYDITNGNNYSSGKGSGYVATVGPDPCTGLGRPLSTLISVLSGTTAPPTSPPPTVPPPTVPPPVSPPPTVPPPVAALGTYNFAPAILRNYWSIVPAGSSPALPHHAFAATLALSSGVNVLTPQDKALSPQQKAEHIAAQMRALPSINWGPILASLEPVVLQILEGLLTNMNAPTTGS